MWAPIQKGKEENPETAWFRFASPLPFPSRAQDSQEIALPPQTITHESNRLPNTFQFGRCTDVRRFTYSSLAWAKRARQPAELVPDPTPSLLFEVEEALKRLLVRVLEYLLSAARGVGLTRTLAPEVYFS